MDTAAEPAPLQSASPSAGARSTARSSPEAISLRNCILLLYTQSPPKSVTRDHKLRLWDCKFYRRMQKNESNMRQPIFR